MSRTALPLMTRLRVRPLASTWLFGLLMLAKFAFGTVCLADELRSTTIADTVVATMTASGSRASDDAGNCWHAGNTGCHCACAHSAAVPAVDGVQLTVPGAITLVPDDGSPLRLTRLQTDLRPPIA